MNKKIVSLCVIALVTSTAFAQKNTKKISTPSVVSVPSNPWVFTYGKDTVYKQEFERLLSKNRNTKDTPTEKDVREYLDLYQNFKMKVKEALAMQLDTISTFKTELAGYRKQLANPYLTDKKASENLVKEAYQHMLKEVNASHILINCKENAKPADTLAAYNKALDIRKQYLKGESFDSLAVKNSEDPSATFNYGNLGWFSAFDMIYPFEKVAYTTPKGQVSMPFRTRFGYHILKVNNIRDAKGEVRVQHIMRSTGENASAATIAEQKAVIDSAYELSKNKLISFDELVAKYSQDEGSKPNKGLMNWFSSSSRFPEEFKEAAFALKEKGDVSKVFITKYGFHIIKLADTRPVGTFKETEENIKTKVARDSRAESSKASVVARIKRENNFKENKVNYATFVKMCDSSMFLDNYQVDETKFTGKQLFSIGNVSYTDKDVAKYIEVTHDMYEPGSSVQMLVNTVYNRFIDDKVLAYEESQLETKYEDFRNLMQEYHDGILLFDLTDKMVWNKAVIDTVGLEKFHENNKEKYMWKERVKVLTYNCLDDKTKKAAIKLIAKGLTPEQIKAKLSKKITGAIVITEQKAERGESPAMDKLYDQKGIVDIPNENNQYKFYFVEGIVGPEPKSLKEAKGIITSDYQNYLEKEWIQMLRNKYPVTVNESTVKQLFK
ncbi:MAG: peptidylprolyl isomerase [Bacteroidia bacterium]|nr:peptidylprolyl isomerase [Bacteroidia bacterium]